MHLLPWLVVHGAAVWKACLALFVLAGLALAWLRPRLASRRAAAIARESFEEPTVPSDAHKGARVTLEGELLAAEAPCQRYEDGSEAAAVSVKPRGLAPGLLGEASGESARAGRLLIRVGEATVRLDGPVDVVLGSREAWPQVALASLAAEVRGRLPGVEIEAPVFRSLAAGDRVWVSGVLGEEAADEAPSYRDAGKRWTLGGVYAAFAGTPRVSGPVARVHAPPVIAAAMLFLALFGGGGEIAMGRAERDLRVFASNPGDAKLGAVLVAAVTPFRRQAALALLGRALDARSDPDPAALAARATLHELQGEEHKAAEMWIAHGEPERGARLAEDVGSHGLAARGWYAAGYFERAADAWERSEDEGWEKLDENRLRFGLVVNLLARRLEGAARAARLLATAYRERPTRSFGLRRFHDTRADNLACLAHALDARRGDAAAWRALHEPLPAPMVPACAVLRVDLFDGKERLSAIRALPAVAWDGYDVPAGWLDRLALEVDPTHDTRLLQGGDPTRVLLVPNEGDPALELPAVDAHVAELREQEGDGGHGGLHGRVQSMASAAVFALLSGDDARARLLAQRLDRDVSDHPRTKLETLAFGAAYERGAEVRSLVLAALGDAPLPDERRPQIADRLLPLTALRARDAGPLLASLVRRDPPDAAEKEAWALAAAGDGEGLARWLGRPWSQPGTFLRLGAPLLRAGREDVARWVRWGHRPVVGFHPTEDVIHLANLAAAAEALAPGDLGASLRARADRFRKAILRRETAVPLAVVERL